jgi:hypothetical protein
MARDDWFRCKAWTKEERAAFDERIARSRKAWSKWQQFTIQAGLLEWHGTAPDAHAEAVRLHERANTLQSLGELAMKAGDEARAEQHLRASIARCPKARRRSSNGTSAEAVLAALLKKRG